MKKNFLQKWKIEKVAFREETSVLKSECKSLSAVCKMAKAVITADLLNEVYSNKSGDFKSEMLELCKNKKRLFSVYEKYLPKVNGVFVSFRKIREGVELSDKTKEMLYYETVETFEKKGFENEIHVAAPVFGNGVISFVNKRKNEEDKYYIVVRTTHTVQDVITAAAAYVMAGMPNFNNSNDGQE